MAVSIIDKTKEDVLVKYIQYIQFHNPHLLCQHITSIDNSYNKINLWCTVCGASGVIPVGYTESAYKNIIDTINNFASGHQHHDLGKMYNKYYSKYYKNGEYLGEYYPIESSLPNAYEDAEWKSYKTYTTYYTTDAGTSGNLFETVEPNSVTLNETTKTTTTTTREVTITIEKTGRKFRRKKG